MNATDAPHTLLAPLPDGYIPAQPFWTIQQLKAFIKILPLPRSCLFMDPRTGKSKPIVDKTCFYFERKSHPLHVTGLLVISYPNGVHRSWVTDIFPEYMPRRVKWKGLVWRADKCRQNGFKQALEAICATPDLALFSVNVESVGSDECRKAIGKFLSRRKRVFVVFDESSALVNSTALRSRTMASIGTGPVSQFVIQKAILDGTPVDKNGPLDYWSQVGWMGHDILGYPNEIEFRKRFAEIKTFGTKVFWSKVKEIREKMIEQGFDKDKAEEIAQRHAKRQIVEVDGVRRRVRRGRDWWEDVARDIDNRPKYRNMEEIWAKLDPISYRATFEECFPDAAKHVYQKRYFQLSEKQRTVYDDLRKRYRAQLDNEEIVADHPLTRLLRCQQITSNYYPDHTAIEIHEDCIGMGCPGCDNSGTIEKEVPLRPIDPDNNPRLAALAEELRYGKPTIVWARFVADVDSIMELAKRLGIAACRYDGQTGPDEKADAKDGFQSGKYDLIAGNEGSMSRGLPLWRGMLMVGYSNTFSFRTRRQIEDRSRHGAKKSATAVVDLVAEETVDDLSIIPALRTGMDVSTWIMRDQKRDWI